MSDIRDLIERYIAVWNETDPVARRRRIDAVWAENGTYIDPLAVAEGREAFDATIAAVQAQFPGLVFSLGGPVDAHHQLARFTWELGPAGGESLVIGFDVAAVGDDGLIETVHGFLDQVPTV